MQNSKLISALIVLLTSVILSLGIGILNYIAGNNTAISYIFCSIPMIISIFYLGATIHLSIVENKIHKSENDEYGEIITQRMNFINNIISKAKLGLKDFHNKLSIESVNTVNINHNNVLSLRRLIDALEERQDRLVELSRTSNYKEAEELSYSPLIFLNSSVYSVNQKQMPSLVFEEWEKSVDTLLYSLGSKKIAA